MNALADQYQVHQFYKIKEFCIGGNCEIFKGRRGQWDFATCWKFCVKNAVIKNEREVGYQAKRRVKAGRVPRKASAPAPMFDERRQCTGCQRFEDVADPRRPTEIICLLKGKVRIDKAFSCLDWRESNE